jgi:hypothetical protein
MRPHLLSGRLAIQLPHCLLGPPDLCRPPGVNRVADGVLQFLQPRLVHRGDQGTGELPTQPTRSFPLGLGLPPFLFCDQPAGPGRQQPPGPHPV